MHVRCRPWTRASASPNLGDVKRITLALGAVALALVTGCSSVRASGVPTGAMRLPPRTGPVAVYAAGYPIGGVDLGVVEVRAAQGEANVETLLPAFVNKGAQLGGNAAVIEHVDARFDVTTHVHVESYTYPCGYYTCVGTRSYPVTGEVVTLIMRGRAVSVGGGKAPPPESTIAPTPPVTAPPAPVGGEP